MRDPAIRPLIITGYKRLAMVLAGAALMVAPTILYGMVAGRITLVVAAVVGAVVSVYSYVKGTWSATFAAAVGTLTIPILGIAWALGLRGANAQIIKDSLCVIVLAGLFYGLPALASRDRKFRERIDRLLADAHRKQQQEHP